MITKGMQRQEIDRLLDEIVYWTIVIRGECSEENGYTDPAYVDEKLRIIQQDCASISKRVKALYG